MAPERALTPQEENVPTPVMSVPASPVAGIPIQNAQSPISILLAVAQSQSRSDDDLTNLNWLHEHDLLKGMNIDPSSSNTVSSHCVENIDNNNTFTGRSLRGCYEVPDSLTSNLHSSSVHPIPHQTPTTLRNKHPNNIPYDPFQKGANIGKGSLWTIDPKYKPSLIQALNRSPINSLSTFNNSSSLDCFSNKSSTSHSPDSDRFPSLARELSENTIDDSDYKANLDSLEAVDAATVMLSLNRGTSFKNMECPPVIMTSPSQDHTYSSADSGNSIRIELEPLECASYRVPGNCTRQKLSLEDDEQQKIKGAETLLNLAGVTLKRRYTDSNDTFEELPKKEKKCPQFDINKNETQEVMFKTLKPPRSKKREKIKKLITRNGELLNSKQEVIYKEDR
nr:forkhead box protein N2-like [Leptinotarsa decemlineata]